MFKLCVYSEPRENDRNPRIDTVGRERCWPNFLPGIVPFLVLGQRYFWAIAADRPLIDMVRRMEGEPMRSDGQVFTVVLSWRGV